MAGILDLPAPLTTKAELQRFVNACCAVSNVKYSDKWEDIVSHVNIAGLSAEVARVLWMGIKDDYVELLNSDDLAMTRDVLCGGVFIYRKETCPGCGKCDSLSDPSESKHRKVRGAWGRLQGLPRQWIHSRCSSVRQELQTL